MTTLICTTLNEELTIEKLLISIKRQTKKPKKVIFVDAGSNDTTRELIREFKKENTIPLQLIKASGVGRSEGRNIAIQEATDGIILSTDAGCVLKQNWIETMTKPFADHEVQSVAGNYMLSSDSTTLWQNIFYLLTSKHPTSIHDASYIPSSRSYAFRKSAWESAGKYPTYLNTAEDLVFAKNVQKIGKQSVAPDAIVYWTPPNTLLAIFRTTFNYSYGDGRAREKSPHNAKYLIKIGLITITVIAYFVGYLSFNFLLVLIIVYTLLSSYRQLSKIDSSVNVRMYKIGITLVLVVLPIFVITLIGYLYGRLTRR